MKTSRLEAFSDGVLAIIITIMVLDLRAPSNPDPAALRPLIPAFLSYVLSFVYVGIYWNNHHHIFHAARRITGMTLWANLHLLFWLSLIPFVTRWIGESHFATWPVAAYGFVLLMAALAWEIERRLLLRAHGPASTLARALDSDLKERLSLALYAVALPTAFADGAVACGLYALVALLWVIPDRRIERALDAKPR
jgi:uncharacterized membrane protein